MGGEDKYIFGSKFDRWFEGFSYGVMCVATVYIIWLFVR